MNRKLLRAALIVNKVKQEMAATLQARVMQEAAWEDSQNSDMDLNPVRNDSLPLSKISIVRTVLDRHDVMRVHVSREIPRRPSNRFHKKIQRHGQADGVAGDEQDGADKTGGPNGGFIDRTRQSDIAKIEASRPPPPPVPAEDDSREGNNDNKRSRASQDIKDYLMNISGNRKKWKRMEERRVVASNAPWSVFSKSFSHLDARIW